MLSSKKTSKSSNRTIHGKQENEHCSCFYHKILFYSSKKARINSTHYVIMKIPNKRELQQMAIN